MRRYSKRLAIFIMMFLCLLTACGEDNREPQVSISQTIISAKEISAFYPNIMFVSQADLQESRDPIVGTWTNGRERFPEIERWQTAYETCFSPDGQVVHCGNRNMDIGTWERIDEKTVIAYFDKCIIPPSIYGEKSFFMKK